MDNDSSCSDSGKEDLRDVDDAAADESVLQLLDSADEYLSLLASLSSILRQGWLDLASARYSTGISRISSSLYDLKVQPAATTLRVETSGDGSLSEPRFTLSKWAFSREAICSEEAEVEELQKKFDTTHLRHRGPQDLSDKEMETCFRTTQKSQVQRARAKSLSVFGALISPKLRSAQISFEKALEIVVEVANMQSSMLSAYTKLQN